MNPQYIYDNSTSPPTQSVLQYAISPDTVFVSTDDQTMYANLIITVFNPSQTETVTCQAFQFGFHVGTDDGDLTPEVTGIESSSSEAPGWTISTQAQESPTIRSYMFSVPRLPVPTRSARTTAWSSAFPTYRLTRRVRTPCRF